MKLLRHVGLTLLAFMLVSCGSGGDDGGLGSKSTNVVINLGHRSADTNTLSIKSIPSAVTHLILTITGPGMTTIVQTENVAGLSEVTVEVEVPNGSDRRFDVSARNISNVEIFTGFAAGIDLEGIPVEVTIIMVSVEDVDPGGLLSQCLSAINSGNFAGAKDACKSAANAFGDEESNDADTARFFAAITGGAFFLDIQSDGQSDGLNDIGDFLDAFGCPVEGRDILTIEMFLENCFYTALIDFDSPTAQDIGNFLYNVIRPELMAAVANLDAISPNTLNITWTEPFTFTQVESDYGDVLAIRAFLKGILAYIHIAAAYFSDVDIDDIIIRFHSDLITLESFLDTNPDFLKLTDASQLPTAKGYLTGSALDDIVAAIDYMLAETDSQTDDLINLVDESAENIMEMRAGLVLAKQCLNGPCTVEDNSTPDTSDDTILNLSRFFAGVDFRPIIPDFEGDTPVGDLPDPTFGGILVLLRGIDASLLNADLDNDGTADVLEFLHGDSYIIYGGMSFLTFPELTGFDLLGIAKSSDGIVDFNGSYPYFMITNALNLLDGNYTEPEIDAFEFLPAGRQKYCCDGIWLTNEYFFDELRMLGPPDGAVGCLGCHAAVGLGEAPEGTTGVRVYGPPQ
jgi:hypothetical protein